MLFLHIQPHKIRTMHKYHSFTKSLKVFTQPVNPANQTNNNPFGHIKLSEHRDTQFNKKYLQKNSTKNISKKFNKNISKKFNKKYLQKIQQKISPKNSTKIFPKFNKIKLSPKISKFSNIPLLLHNFF